MEAVPSIMERIVSAPSTQTTIAAVRRRTLLLDFPNLKFSGVLIADWLNVWDLGRLDSAVCNRAQDLRAKFLRMFGPTSMFLMTSSNMSVSKLLDEVDPMESRVMQSADGFRYLMKRNIALTVLSISLFMDKEVLQQYLTQYGQRIRILEFCGHCGNVDSWQLYYDLLQYCPRLQAIVFRRGASFLCTQDVAEFTQCCPQLQLLKFENKFHMMVPKGIRAYDKTQPNLAIAALPQLRSFTLHGYSKSAVNLTTALAQHCPALTAIDLTGCTGLTGAALVKLGTDAAFTLQKMNLNQCSKLTSVEMIAFLTANGEKNEALSSLHLSKTEVSNDLLTALAQKCPSLLLLDVRHSRGFTAAGVTALVQGCTALTSLSFANTDAVTDDGVDLLTLRCVRLEALVLHSCSKITDASLEYISRRCAYLRTLDIGGRSAVTEAGFVAAVSTVPTGFHRSDPPMDSPPQVADSKVTNNNNIPVDGAQEAVKQGAVLDCTFGAQLTDLNVSDLAALGEGALQAIAAHCPRLRKLDISGLKRIAESSIVAVAQGLSTAAAALRSSNVEETGLQELILNEHYHLRDEAVRAVATLLGSSLRVLSLAGCEKLTDGGLVVVAQQCRGLRSLRISGIDAVTDLTVDAITRHCPHLRALHTSDCAQLTDASMRYIGAGLRHLSVLDVSGCAKITDAGIHCIITQCLELGEFVKPT